MRYGGKVGVKIDVMFGRRHVWLPALCY